MIWDDTPFAANFLEAEKTAAIQDWVNPRLLQTATRRAFTAGPHAPLATSAAGGMIGTATGGAAGLAAAPFVPDAHLLGLAPAAGAAVGALPGALQGVARIPSQMSGLIRHLGH